MPTKVLHRIQPGVQISVFLENEPGTLGKACALLGDRGINIFAISLAEGLDHGYVRMVVDQPETALRVFQETGTLSYTRDVLLLELANTPGSLGAICRRLAEAGINLEYAYCAGGPGVEHGLVVMRVDDNEKALRVLKGS